MSISRKSGKSSSRTVRKAIAREPLDRAFGADVLRQARELAGEYRIILEANDELGFVGHVLEMPGVMADGKTPTECVAAVREAASASVGVMLEQGQSPPRPAGERRRQAQLNLRVTDEEKLVLEEAASRRGFRGVSEFVRDAALHRARSA
jgi:predicted RNase H-like HicB family nuclease